jgi:hypothetical protein
LSEVRGLVDLLAYQNLCTVNLWFVRYELIIEGVESVASLFDNIPLCYVVVVVVVDAKLHYGECVAAGVIL